jgi:prohibitin 2
MRADTLAKLIGFAILIFVIVISLASASFVVDPGYRGVEVTLGKVSPVFKPEGFGWKAPFVTHIVPVSIRQQTREVQAPCYSSDLQQVNMNLKVLYRVPESSVVQIYQGYAGDPFDSLIAPRVQDALKEITALQSAEQIVKSREAIKVKALDATKRKIGDLLVVEDVVIQNIDLSKELENAIEAKMVQEQEAAKAKFTQQKTQIEADTAVIKAKGEAESIRIRGEALKQTPAFIELQIVEKWDGKAPLVINGNGASGANILLPLTDLQKQRAAQ